MKHIGFGLVLLILGMGPPAHAQQVSIRLGPHCPTETRCICTPAPCGYWTTRQQWVFVPGFWTSWQHPCGSYQKRWVPGRYRLVTQQIWVPYGPPPPNLYCRR